MSQSVITIQFEMYKAQQEQLGLPVVLDEIVLANVPNLDPNLPIPRDESLPAVEQIVYTSEVSQSGFVNPNAVIYSLIMDSFTGNFNFNWLGLRNKASGTLAAISHFPLTQKTKTDNKVTGNAITRSVLMSFSGAKVLTGIDIDASTWQIDFTARLKGIDERARQENIDHYGAGSFIEDGYLIEKVGEHYQVTPGVGYLGGLRCKAENSLELIVKSEPCFVYLDASWQGQLTSKWETVERFVVSKEVKSDYIDDNGFEHYLVQLAEIHLDGSLTDLRVVVGSIYERRDNAATNADIDEESVEEKHIKLPQFWRAISPQKLIDKLWLGMAARIFPVGSAIPWFTDIAPDGFAIMKNQAFDKVENPELAKVFRNGIIPDMRGCGVIGKEEHETVGRFEEGRVKKHGHPGSIANSNDLGTKKTATDTHNHKYHTPFNNGADGWGNGSNQSGGYANIRTSQGTSTTSNSHDHSVYIGSHGHSIVIALFGAFKNTIDHRKVNWIVRMA